MNNKHYPESMRAEWDAIVIASFLETNSNTFTEEFRSVDDINDAFVELHARTIKYRRTQSRTNRSDITSLSLSSIIHNYIDIYHQDNNTQDNTQDSYAEDYTNINWLQSIVIEENSISAISIIIDNNHEIELIDETTAITDSIDNSVPASEAIVTTNSINNTVLTQNIVIEETATTTETATATATATATETATDSMQYNQPDTKRRRQ
jgi:hypothetical protein